MIVQNGIDIAAIHAAGAAEARRGAACSPSARSIRSIASTEIVRCA
jgi:hypothetical protein